MNISIYPEIHETKIQKQEQVCKITNNETEQCTSVSRIRISTKIANWSNLSFVSIFYYS
jgi:hypothetical protein